MLVVNVPIESIESRYSKQWNAFLPGELHRHGLEVVSVVPPQVPSEYKIEVGEFLDVYGTCTFKSYQMAALVEGLRCGRFGDEFVVLLNDGWYPGVEHLFYIRNGARVRFNIAAIFHAGTYDPADFTHRVGMNSWGQHVERGWLEGYDLIFVSCDYHKDLIVRRRGSRYASKIVALGGFPLFDSPPVLSDELFDAKERIVVFPHRLAPEKRPDAFDAIADRLKEEFPGWRFVKTVEACNGKADYYALLEKAWVAVSCAEQETFGIAQQEAVNRGCLPCVPDRLSYPEFYDAQFRYPSDYTGPGRYDQLAEHIGKMIRWVESDGEAVRAQVRVLSRQLQARNKMAVAKMARLLKELSAGE